MNIFIVLTGIVLGCVHYNAFLDRKVFFNATTHLRMFRNGFVLCEVDVLGGMGEVSRGTVALFSQDDPDCCRFHVHSSFETPAAWTFPSMGAFGLVLLLRGIQCE